MLPTFPGRSRYIVGMSVDSIARGLYLPLSLIFFHTVGGMPLTTVGASLTAAGIVGLVGNPVGGMIIDRHGARNVVSACYIVRAVGFVTYLWVHNPVSLICAAGLVSLADRAYVPALQALITELSAGTRRERMLALQRTIRNGGYGVGSLIASSLLAVSGVAAFRLIILLCGLAFLAAAVLASTLRGSGAPNRRRAPGEGYRQVLADRQFLTLCALNVPMALCYSAFSGLIPIFALYTLRAPASLPGVLYALNTVLVTIAQMPVSRLQEPFRRTRGSALGAAIFAGTCAGFATLVWLPAGAASTIGLFTLVVTFTMAELIHTTASKSLAADLGPATLRGRYLSIYQMSYSVAQIVAPALFTFVLAVHSSLIWGLLAAAAAVTAVGLIRIEPRLPPEAVLPPRLADAETPAADPSRQPVPAFRSEEDL